MWSYSSRLNLMLLINLWNGYPHDPDYIKAYRRYWRRPTQSAPPLPGDYATQEMAWYGPGIAEAALQRRARIESFPAVGRAGLKIASGSGEISVRNDDGQRR